MGGKCLPGIYRQVSILQLITKRIPDCIVTHRRKIRAASLSRTELVATAIRSRDMVVVNSRGSFQSSISPKRVFYVYSRLLVVVVRNS